MSCCFSCFGWCRTKRTKAKAFYLTNGHRFMSQRIKTNAVCDHCNKRLWNLKRKAHSCMFCDIVVHKKCRVLVSQCGEDKKDQQGSAEERHDPETTQDEQGSVHVVQVHVPKPTPSMDQQGSAEEKRVPETTQDEQGSVHVVQVHVPKPTPSMDQQGSAEEKRVPETTQDEQGSAHVVQVHVPKSTPSMDQQGPAEEKRVPETTQDEQGSAHVVQVHVPKPTPSMDQQGSAEKKRVPETTQDEQGSAHVVQVHVPEPTPSMEKRYHDIQDFNFIKALGQGSFGKVHLVQAKKDKQEYALKLVSKKRAQEKVLLRFIWSERSILRQTYACPFLVKLTSCFQTPTKLCYLMEYASGGNLHNLLILKGKLPEDHLRFYAAEMSLGIHFLHRCTIIHRDIKLKNIMLDAEGHIKIGDFGLSKEYVTKKGTDTPCGTPQFSAPEIHMEKVYGFAVDWWALGIVLFRMATLQFPFADDVKKLDSTALMNAIISKPARIPDYVSENLRALLKGFLRKNPEMRLGSWPEPGFFFLKLHPFFHDMDWDMAEKKMIPPPYKPDSEEYIGEYKEVELSAIKQEELDEINQKKFSGFECFPLG